MTTLDLDAIVLGHGSHTSPDKGMCVMEAVSLLAGEEWSDSPQCASPVISAFLRSWNDSLADDDRQQLKRYIPRLIGSRGDEALESKRAWMATDWLVRVHTPAWLRLAGLTGQADMLAGLAELTPESAPAIRPTLEAVRQDAAAAWAADGDAPAWVAWAVAADAAAAAAWAADGDAPAWVAAWAAGAGAADGAAAGDAPVWVAPAPTVKLLQAEAHALVDRMLEAN